MHNASSGKPGKTNSKGRRILLFPSIRFCAFSKSFLPISFLAIPSPNLSPIKNNIEEEMKFAIIQAIKVFRGPNRTIPKINNVEFNNGTKHSNIRASVDIKQ